MGRPLKQKYFDPVEGTASIGGEGVTTTSGNVALTFANIGLGYFSANATVTFSAPQLPGGVTALGTPVLWANGAIQAVTITNAGTGYTTKPTLSFTGANTYAASATITGGGLTSSVTNVITTSAYIPAADGGSSAVVGDIVKQVGTRRYKVTTAQGTGKCKLVAAAPSAGQMTVAATDSLGSTYYVTKLTENLATLTQNSDGGSGFEFETGERARWTLSSADTGIVQIASN